MSSAPAEYLVISTSLRAGSRSRLLGQFLARSLGGEHIDLREFPLPLCDGETAYSAPGVAELAGRIRAARVVLLAIPIYNYDANAAAKNLIELTGRAWTGKIVGFACAAGGDSSYMSILGLANSLMLDFRCVIIPRFVYTTEEHFTGDAIAPEIEQRLTQLAEAARGLRVTG